MPTSARAEGRPLPSFIFYGIEEPEKEDERAPAPSHSSEEGRRKVTDAELARLRDAALRDEEKAKEEARRQKHERFLAREIEIVRNIERSGEVINDAETFLRVRLIMRSFTRPYASTTAAGDLVLGTFSRRLVQDVNRICECQAGRRYILAVSYDLDPWPDGKLAGFLQLEVPRPARIQPAARPRATPSVVEQTWNRNRRGKGR